MREINGVRKIHGAKVCYYQKLYTTTDNKQIQNINDKFLTIYFKRLIPLYPTKHII